MNEQLIVKNFGPIKDATVDFKRVTVFIGPTGGGKSTLAKLAAVFRDTTSLIKPLDIKANTAYLNILLRQFNLWDYMKENGEVVWKSKYDEFIYKLDTRRAFKHKSDITKEELKAGGYLVRKDAIKLPYPKLKNSQTILNEANNEQKILIKKYYSRYREIFYMPAERIVAAMIEIGIAKQPLSHNKFPLALSLFIEKYRHCRYALRNKPLNIPFLNATYGEGKNYLVIKSPDTGEYDLSKSASGIQAVAPMMQIIIYNTTHDSFMYYPKSFIVEEPELNLYPTAQQGLLSWLVEKCTKGENDLTITTHSPYLLAHLNTLLFAYQVAQNHPERADEISKIVPRESWLDPKEFAAYHVEGQKENGVRSIVNPETGLISYNGLDAIASAEATEFEKLLDINAGLQVEW